MAKQKAVEQTPQDTEVYTSMEQLDAALNRYGLEKAEIERIVAEYNRKEQEARQAMEVALAPHMAAHDKLERSIKAYCESNRKAVEKSGASLRFGEVSFKKSPPAVSICKGFNEKDIIEKIRKSVWSSLFIRTKYELDKTAIKKSAGLYETDKSNVNAISPKKLAGFGLEVKQGENFNITVKQAAEGVA